MVKMKQTKDSRNCQVFMWRNVCLPHVQLIFKRAL